MNRNERTLAAHANHLHDNPIKYGYAFIHGHLSPKRRRGRTLPHKTCPTNTRIQPRQLETNTTRTITPNHLDSHIAHYEPNNA